MNPHDKPNRPDAAAAQSDAQPIAERNVERLLQEAYRPEVADPRWIDRTTAAMHRASQQRVRRVRTPRPTIATSRVAVWTAAAVLLVAVGVMLGGMWRSAADRSRDRNETIAEAPPAVVPGSDPFEVPNPEQLAASTGMVPLPAPQRSPGETLVVGGSLETGASQRRRTTLPDGSILYLNTNTSVTLSGPRRVTLHRGEVYVEVSPRHPAEGQETRDEDRFAVVTPRRTITALGTRFHVGHSDAGTRVTVTQGKVRVSGLKLPLLAGQQLAAGIGKAADATLEVSAAPRATHVIEWTRDLIAAARSPLVPASDHTGGALIAIDPDGQEMKLSLRKVHVDVYIEDGFARTTIDQTYFNHLSSRLEGTFYFPLPPDASLSRLAMYVGERLMEGGMAERRHARETFENIVRKMQDPALLEWIDGSTFKMRVFPLEGRQEKRIVLSYTQRLPSLYRQTSYRFPAGHNLPIVKQWSATVRVKDAGRLRFQSDSHDFQADRQGNDLLLTASAENVKPNRDVVLSLHRRKQDARADAAVRFSLARHEGSQYLMLRWRPELSTRQERQRRDWVILFEAAADRDPVLARAQIDVVKALLENAEHDDTFVILTAGTRVHRLLGERLATTPENVARAIGLLGQTHLIGALDLGRAFEAAGALAEDCENAYLVHVGSGVPILGERDTTALLERIPQNMRYVGIGVGKRWGRTLMKRAAAQTGGYFTQINPDEEITWRAMELLATLNTARLLNVAVVDTAEKLTFLCHGDSLADGEELCAIARLDKDEHLPASVEVTGMLDGKLHTERFAVGDVTEGAGYLPRIWAKLEIDRLLAAGGERHREEIVRLSKAMYVMSPFTSLLVLENEAMYEQYGIDRGRKDHWALYPCPERIDVVHEPLKALSTANDGTAPRKKSVADVLRTIVIRRPRPMLRWPGQLASSNVLQVPILTLYNGQQAYIVPQSGAGNAWWYYDPPIVENTPLSGISAALSAYGATASAGLTWDKEADRFTTFPNVTVPEGGTIISGGTEFDSLIDLIESIIQPSTWSEVGGSGSIAGFDTNLSLVVSQNQEVHSLQRQERLAAFVDEFNGLLDEQRFAEAEVVAARARELDPENPVAKQISKQIRFTRWFMANKASRDGREKGFMEAMQSVDRSGIPFDDQDPFTASSWSDVRRSPYPGMGGMGGMSGGMGGMMRGMMGGMGGGMGGMGYGAMGARLLSARGDSRNSGLIEPVRIEMLEGLDVLVIRGHQRDVDRTMQIIEQIESLGTSDELPTRFYPVADLVSPIRGNGWNDYLGNAMELRIRRQKGVVDMLFQTELARAPFNGPPIVYLDAEVWQQLTRRRAETYRSMSLAGTSLASTSLAEKRINDAMKSPTQLDFRQTPLRDVVDYLNDYHGIEIQIDRVAFEDIGLTEDVRVTKTLRGISLRSALRLMLRDLDLTYVIVDAALLITTPEEAENRLNNEARWALAMHRLETNSFGRHLAYQAPSFENRWSGFCDLWSYAPGMRTTRADVAAVLEAELPSDSPVKTGRIDPRARRLIERARGIGWQTATIRDKQGEVRLSIDFDGTGRCRYERTTGRGLREQVLSDGVHLWHIYPELGLGTRRALSRFHRRELLRLIPWVVPPVEQLARGADLNMIGKHTVALVPQGIEKLEDRQGKPLKYALWHLVFDTDGRLAERRLVEMPSKKTLLRQVCAADGSIEWLDGEDKSLAKRNIDLTPGGAPDLKPDAAKLVILPMPLRDEGFVNADGCEDWSEEEAIQKISVALLYNPSAATSIVLRRFFNRGDRRLGLYLPLIANGQSWNTKESRSVDNVQVKCDPLADHPDDPLAKYLADYLRIRHEGKGEFGPIGGPRDGLLRQLAEFHNLWEAFESKQMKEGDATRRRPYREQAVDFIRRSKSPELSWALLDVLRQQSDNQQAYREVAEAAESLRHVPMLAYVARYEQARATSKSGDGPAAQKLFEKLYSDAVKSGYVPPIDDDFRRGLEGGPDAAKKWAPVMRATAKKLLAHDARSMAIRLAWLVHQLGDPTLAAEIFEQAHGTDVRDESLAVTLTAVEYLWHTGQHSRADGLLRPLLQDGPYAKQPGLWRLAAMVAEKRGMTAQALSDTQRAMEIDYENRPEKLDLRVVRRQHSELLDGYAQLAKAVATLESQPPRELVARVVHLADRWRSMDPDPTEACQQAAKILSDLGAADLAWDYLTTPLAAKPNEAVSWKQLAEELRNLTQFELAARAYASAFTAEPSDPQLLWDRAQVLFDAGHKDRARAVLATIADGRWQPRFETLQTKVKKRLEVE